MDKTTTICSVVLNVYDDDPIGVYMEEAAQNWMKENKMIRQPVLNNFSITPLNETTILVVFMFA